MTAKEATETSTEYLTLKADDVRRVAALVHVASTDRARPILQCVQMVVADGELTATTTNSYALASATVPLDPSSDIQDGEYLVNAKALASAVKAAGKMPKVSMGIDGDWLTVYGETRQAVRIEDGTFPNWRRLIPEGEGAELSTIALSPKLLYDLGRAADLVMTTRKGWALTLTFYSEIKPVIARTSARPGFFGLIMPVRV